MKERGRKHENKQEHVKFIEMMVLTQRLPMSVSFFLVSFYKNCKTFTKN